jgi:Capsule assembly protein Wzi
MIKRIGLGVTVLLAGSLGEAGARGVTPYLPLNLDPQIERQVERVLILADKPVMRRPIPAAVVLDALPKACEVDAVLCERVRRFLANYMHVSGVAFASYEVATASGSGDKTVLPNQHGASADSHYRAAAAGYLQPSDYVLLSVGGVADEGRATATGSMLSAGFDWAQLDLGYRDHWWSPMTDSSMLISTEAPTMPSITLSNYRPLTRLGLQYELFVARMSHSNDIELTNGTLTRGYPKFGGLHLSFEPVSGWALGAQRIIVWGGGAAGGQSFKNILKAFFNPSRAQSTGFGTQSQDVIGKQEGGVSSRFIFPGRTPFAVYFEYAGNDTVQGHNYLLGKPDLSGGIDFPRVGPFDLTFEASQWEPTWYVHHHSTVQTGYGDGITNDRLTIGHWFGDQRVFGDAVGGRSNMLRVGWEPPFGGRLEAEYRMLVNDSYYSAIPYRHENVGSLSYSHPWREYAVGVEVDAGRDVFGGSFTRVAGFLRYGDALRSGNAESLDESLGAERADGSELYLDVGVSSNRIQQDIASTLPRTSTPASSGAHIGIGARRQVSEHQDLGVAIEADDIRGRSLFSVRALDYRYRFDSPLALNLFFGASRYSLNTPAYGWYFGAGPQWRNVLPGWDLEVNYKYGIKISRLRVSPTDPNPPGDYRPDAFYNVYLWTLGVSRRF